MVRLLRPLFWIASSKRDYRKFPDRVQHTLGFELFLAQTAPTIGEAAERIQQRYRRVGGGLRWQHLPGSLHGAF
jgi:hypothetical protein